MDPLTLMMIPQLLAGLAGGGQRQASPQPSPFKLSAIGDNAQAAMQQWMEMMQQRQQQLAVPPASAIVQNVLGGGYG